MPTVNIFEAKSSLSRLIEAVESGKVSEIIIARNGKPAARLVPIQELPAGQRIGVAKGKFTAPDPDPVADKIIQNMFEGRPKTRNKRKP